MTTPSLREAATLALEALDRASATLVRYDIPGTQNWIVGAMQPALESLRAALALRDAEPVAQWQKKHQARTSGKWENTDEHDAKWWITNAQGWEIRALYAAPQPAPIAPAAYDQTALELCNECGWKALIPGECCLSCERNKPAPLERKPLSMSMFASRADYDEAIKGAA
jgi:hypothetical protein